MWDLNGLDKSRPLSEMIDMHSYQQRMETSRRQAVRQQERSERRTAVLGVTAMLAILIYLVHAMVPGGLWTVAQVFI